MTTTTFIHTATTTATKYRVTDGPRIGVEATGGSIRITVATLTATNDSPDTVDFCGPRQIYRGKGIFADGRDGGSGSYSIDDPDLTPREIAFANDLIAATINADPANPHMYAPATGDEVAQARRFLTFHNLPATYDAISEEVTNGRAEAHADRIADSA